MKETHNESIGVINTSHHDDMIVNHDTEELIVTQTEDETQEESESENTVICEHRINENTSLWRRIFNLDNEMFLTEQTSSLSKRIIAVICECNCFILKTYHLFR